MHGSFMFINASVQRFDVRLFGNMTVNEYVVTRGALGMHAPQYFSCTMSMHIVPSLIMLQFLISVAKLCPP